MFRLVSNQPFSGQFRTICLKSKHNEHLTLKYYINNTTHSDTPYTFIIFSDSTRFIKASIRCLFIQKLTIQVKMQNFEKGQ
jgi:hypothetical protein